MPEPIVIPCPECEKQVRAPADAVGKKVRCKNCEHIFVIERPPGKADREAIKETPSKKDKITKGPAPAHPSDKAPDKAIKRVKPEKTVKPPEKVVVPFEDDEDDDGNPYGVTDTRLGYRCPQCAAEMESEEAVICLECGFNTQDRTLGQTKKTREPTGGEVFLWLLPGIGCVAGTLLLIGYAFFHHFALPKMVFKNPAWTELVAKHGGRNAAAGHEDTGPEGYLFHAGVELWVFIMFTWVSYYMVKFAIKRLIFDNKPPEIALK